MTMFADQAGNDLPRYATPARHVWEAMLAAAPTQQQERSDADQA